METKNLKKLFKYFIFLFLINLLIINWNEISLILNYKVISGATTNFFQNNSQKGIPGVFGEEIEHFNKEDSVEIPKISVLAPLIFVSREEEIEEALDGGVVHFPNSVLLGEKGQTIILGHSAPPDWPKIKYDWIFSRLDELKERDEIFVYFNNRKYTYYVSGKTFLNKGEEIPKDDLTNSENVLVLLSCWPPGKSQKRIIVEAQQE